MNEAHAVKTRQRFGIRVVADDQRNRAGQFSGSMPVQQVRQAMLIPGNKQRDLRQVARVFDAPSELQRAGNCRELPVKRGFVQVEIGQVPLDPHEEQSEFIVAVLIRVQDVRAAAVEKGGYLGHQALAVGGVNQ
jgi:hypothetical protein